MTLATPGMNPVMTWRDKLWRFKINAFFMTFTWFATPGTPINRYRVGRELCMQFNALTIEDAREIWEYSKWA